MVTVLTVTEPTLVRIPVQRHNDTRKWTEARLVIDVADCFSACLINFMPPLCPVRIFAWRFVTLTCAVWRPNSLTWWRL